jgi:hypothetical protein
MFFFIPFLPNSKYVSIIEDINGVNDVIISVIGIFKGKFVLLINICNIQKGRERPYIIMKKNVALFLNRLV